MALVQRVERQEGCAFRAGSALHVVALVRQGWATIDHAARRSRQGRRTAVHVVAVVHQDRLGTCSSSCVANEGREEGTGQVAEKIGQKVVLARI